jgi:hypothetical protein
MRDLWEPMRASSLPSHELFGGEAIKARFEAGQPECIAHVIRWAESGKEHDPNVYASYVAIRNWYWGGDYLPDPLVRHADRRIARAVCAKVVE